jgi:formylglycine-generating enzyme required for sulfatase activity
MVVIPAGSFQMGSTTGDADEKPVHNVNVKGFALGKYEVTRGQFAAFVAASGHNAGNSCWVFTRNDWRDTPERNWRNPGFTQTDKDPVACVNWEDAQAYVKWVSQKSGKQYRLPSESEWEYACRAGAKQTYCGSDNVDSVAVYDRKGGDKTQPVGGKRANAWGLFDMSGNVFEWTQDCWNDTYSGAPSDGRPWTTRICGERVLRGSGWLLNAAETRAAIRMRNTAANRSDISGFRLARIAP